MIVARHVFALVAACAGALCSGCSTAAPNPIAMPSIHIVETHEPIQSMSRVRIGSIRAPVSESLADAGFTIVADRSKHAGSLWNQADYVLHLNHDAGDGFVSVSASLIEPGGIEVLGHTLHRELVCARCGELELRRFSRQTAQSLAAIVVRKFVLAPANCGSRPASRYRLVFSNVNPSVHDDIELALGFTSGYHSHRVLAADNTSYHLSLATCSAGHALGRVLRRLMAELNIDADVARSRNEVHVEAIHASWLRAKQIR